MAADVLYQGILKHNDIRLRQLDGLALAQV